MVENKVDLFLYKLWYYISRWIEEYYEAEDLDLLNISLRIQYQMKHLEAKASEFLETCFLISDDDK